ncbi:hypothetical protein KKC91_09835 [bacterium]|nr:hypothetical protein [bacterium]
MEKKLLPIIIFVLLFFLIGNTSAYTLSSKNDYLWVEYGKQIKEKNGSVTQPLSIYYGRFPDRKGDVSGLKDIKVFYTLNKKNENGENIFYGADIEEDKKTSFVRINSLKTNCVTVLVKGKRNFKGVECNYLAKASFLLFGHSPFKEKEIEPVLSDEISDRFEICIAPEHSCWPQTGNHVKLTPLFDKNHLCKKKIHIADENKNPIDVETNDEGNFVYISSDDKKLRQKGLTAYKQTVILAEETEGNIIYKSSYTLLFHRSRFGSRNLILGGSIFAGTIAVTFIIIAVRRRKFQV